MTDTGLGRICRGAAGGAALLLLCGCSSEGGGWIEYLRLFRQSIAAQVSDNGVTRNQAASISYASLGYRVDGGREAILVLATDNDDDLLWTAASHVVLNTRQGRIVRSLGLPHDIASLIPANGPSLPPLLDAIKAPYHSVRMMDFPDIGAYSIAASCVTTARGPQTITIIGTTIPTVRVDEICQVEKPRWRFTDSYWLDAKSGFVWHAVQHVHPNGTTIQTEIFRPPE